MYVYIYIYPTRKTWKMKPNPLQRQSCTCTGSFPMFSQHAIFYWCIYLWHIIMMFLIHAVLSTEHRCPSMRSNMHARTVLVLVTCMEWCGGVVDLEHSLLFNILHYALVWFLVPLANPSNFSHCKCFSSRYSLCIMTCISGTSRGVQEEKTGLIRYLLEYLWTNNYSNE